LAEEILFGSLSSGGEVNVSLSDNELSFDFEEVPA